MHQIIGRTRHFTLRLEKAIWVLIIGISINLESMSCKTDNSSDSVSLRADTLDDTQILFNAIETRFSRCESESRELDRCSAQLIAFGQSGALYPNSMEELNDVYCPTFKKTVECIKNNTECFKPFERQIISWILTSTRRMNHKRCKNELEKQRFLKLTHSCFSPMREPMDKCMSKYIANLEGIADLSEYGSRLSDNDLQIQLSCCANRKFKQCVMNQAKRQCKPTDSLQKLKRANSVSSQRIAKKSLQKASADMMDDLKKTLDGMALTGPELICQNIDENFCRTNFDGKFSSRLPRHKSIIPAMMIIYSNS